MIHFRPNAIIKFLGRNHVPIIVTYRQHSQNRAHFDVNLQHTRFFPGHLDMVFFFYENNADSPGESI